MMLTMLTTAMVMLFMDSAGTWWGRVLLSTHGASRKRTAWCVTFAEHTRTHAGNAEFLEPIP